MVELESLVSILDVLATDSWPFHDTKNLLQEERKSREASRERKKKDVEPGNQVGEPPRQARCVRTCVCVCVSPWPLCVYITHGYVHACMPHSVETLHAYTINAMNE